MKQPGFLTFAALAFAALPSSQALGRDVVVGFSPHQNADVLKAQVERVVHHLADTVAPGEAAHLFDASRVRIITTFTVPDRTAYANPRTKLQINRDAIAKLKGFIGSAEPIPGKVGRIDLPAFLRAIGEHYPAADGADLIILGSPIYDDPQAPSLSMLNGRVPNDGHITTHLGQSPYGIRGLRGSLEGYNVYFGDLGGNWSVSTAHAFHVERFWTLSVEGHGGSLAYFGDDLETLFGLAGSDRPDRVSDDGPVETEKLEMLQFAPDTGAVADIFTTPLAEEPAPEPVWANAANVTLGITWDAPDVDLDLYVRPNPSASVIFFDNATTAEGRLFKDFRASPRTGFETVALNGRVDLSKLRPAINFFGGRAPEGRVQGEIRIAIGEIVWAKTFAIKRSSGNQGMGAETAVLENTAPNDAWVILDPLMILGVQ